MRVLVTGILGFAGGHLAEALLARGQAEVIGLARQADWPAELQHLAGRITLRACDLCDRPTVDALVREVQPDQIYHLAGYPHVHRSFEEADAAWAGNLTATRNLYDAVVRWRGQPTILYVGSGLVYGDSEQEDTSYDETSLLRPTSPYAASKAAGDLVSYQYWRSPGLAIVRVRPFNHIGPRQSPQFAAAHFAQQIAEIERGQRPAILETGNLTPLRDLTDVRDMTQAYLLLMDRGRPGESYNAASGEVHSMREVLDRLLALARVRVEVRQRPQLVRATETAVIRGDSGRLRRRTGWVPRTTLDQTLADMLNYWRQASPPGQRMEP